METEIEELRQEKQAAAESHQEREALLQGEIQEYVQSHAKANDSLRLRRKLQAQKDTALETEAQRVSEIVRHTGTLVYLKATIRPLP